ncbi:hypothetical protein [Rhodoblastus sp.]|uniref:hypothetical protein n=1 Tax=Rhodoblastus sp. TaxID=1962975 RepID=UPI0035B3ED2D
MGQFIRICGLTGAAALVLAAAPATAGGHFGAPGFAGHGGVRMVRPGMGPQMGPRPGVVARPGFVAGARPPFAPGFRPGYFGPRPGFYGPYSRYGYYRRPWFAPPYAYGAGGFWSGANVAYATPYPVDTPAYPPYPLGYGDASYTPTGYGVSYNVPPPDWAPAKIITIRGNRAVRQTYLRPRQTIIVRGSASVD